MNRWSDTRDLTARQRPVQSLGPHLLLYLCGCKGARAGGVFRGPVAWRCPACATKGKE